MTEHVSAELLAGYAGGDTGIAPDVAWAVQVHLECCPVCRGRLADRVDAGAAALLARVWQGVDAVVAVTAPAPTRRRWVPRLPVRWVTPVLLPWLVTSVFVVVVALGFDLAAAGWRGSLPSLVLLLAPVAPLLGVAAAWTGRVDPAHELVAATARAGLGLVLRRTVVVLLVVIPVLTGAGWLIGVSPARWLLPCLAFAAGSLALGGAIGLPRAAGGLAVLWAVAVVAPSILTARTSVLLSPAALPGWAALTAAVLLVLVARRRAFTQFR